MTAPIRLLFLIRSMGWGGAQRQLIELVKGLDKSRFSVTVLTFYHGGGLFAELGQVSSVRLISLGKKGRWDLLPFFFRLWRTVRAARPEILHGYMGVSNELCLLMGKALRAKVVWGLRASNMDFSHYSRTSRGFFRLGAWLSRFPDLIIANSRSGQAHYARQGYCVQNMRIIPNGIDTSRFYHDPAGGLAFRKAWGLGSHDVVVGHVGRLDPMKDHPTFIAAAILLANRLDSVQFVSVGEGASNYVEKIKQLGQDSALQNRLLWIPPQNQMPACYSALDVLVSSSAFGEGFSNVIGEAMACQVPCVVTDVGDSAYIVGQAGKVVPPADPCALAIALAALLQLSADQKSQLGQAARRRIIDHFDHRVLITVTSHALKALLENP